MATYQDYGQMLRDYYAAQGNAPAQPYFDPQAEVSGGGQAPGYAAAQDAYNQWTTKTGQGWLDSLPPQQRAEYEALHRQAVEANAKKARNGALIAISAPLLAAGAGAALGSGGFGSLGLGGEAAGGAAGGAFNAAADSQLASSLFGITGADAAGAASIPAWATGAAGGGAAGGAGLLGSIGSALGGAKGLGAIGAVAGGLLGATQKSPTDTMTRTIDPRMANYLYGADGTSGILGGVNDLWKKQMAQGGLNDVQREGLNRQLATLRDPRYSQGFDAMRSSGLGLLGMPIAGNPYTTR